jgi:hypothetical protein
MSGNPYEIHGIDYSDLAAPGLSTTVDEALENVANFVRQHNRAMSAYVINANFSVADEIKPGHVLRWSSLEVLLAAHGVPVKVEGPLS